MEISAEDIVDARMGEMAWINFWEVEPRTKGYWMPKSKCNKVKIQA